MGERVAAASLEFRRASAGRRPRRALEQEAERAHTTSAATERTQARADRDAEESRDRLHHGIFCSRYRLCADLAHLVDGRCGGNRNLSDHACLRVSQRRANQNPGRSDSAFRAGEPGGDCSMNVAVAVDDEGRYEARPSASEAGPAAKRIVVGYGFWVFLLSDIVMFAAIFAAYAVLGHATAAGPSGVQLFNQRSLAIETGCLLASSYTCGLMSLALSSRRYPLTYFPPPTPLFRRPPFLA